MEPHTLSSPDDLFVQMRGAIARGQPFDIVILDQNMPDVSGVYLARQIRAAPDLQHVKLILATSAGLPNPSDEARHVGFDKFLAKPINRSTLIAGICDTLGEQAFSPLAAAGQPMAAQGVTGRHAPARTVPLESYSGSRYRILVAEDNEINQLVITSMLKNAGHNVTLAVDGREAVQFALDRDFDLVLMDIQMPELSGMEAAKEIRKAPGPRSQVPIVALTAHVMENVKEEVIAAGMQDHLSKPISRKDVENAIVKWSMKSTPLSLESLERDLDLLNMEVLRELEAAAGRDNTHQIITMFLTAPRLTTSRRWATTSRTATAKG